MSPVETPALAESDGLRRLNPLEIADWDKHLAGFPAATIFHTAAWARLLHASYGHTPLYFARVSSGRLRSVLPVMEVNSWLTGRRGVSLPFTDECRALCPDAGSFHELYESTLAYGAGRKWRYLECRGGKEWLPEVPPSRSFANHQLDLQADPAMLFKRFDDATQRAIRKAERNGLKIEFTQSIEAVRSFYDLLCLTRQRHGVPPQPFGFFVNFHAHILVPGHGLVVLARHGQIPVAAAVFLHFGRTAIYKWGASDETYQHLRGNNLVMWSALQNYVQSGHQLLDFGRTASDNEGLRRFKRGWGTTERTLSYIRYNLQAADYTRASDAPPGMATRLFQRVPLSLSRIVGAFLYPHWD